MVFICMALIVNDVGHFSQAGVFRVVIVRILCGVFKNLPLILPFFSVTL